MLASFVALPCHGFSSAESMNYFKWSGKPHRKGVEAQEKTCCV